MQDHILLKQVVRRLDILIALHLETLGGSEAARPTAKIQHLAGLGLLPSEVASILGKSTNYVTATLSQMKKRKKRKEANT
ncbi:MAG: hypothetical protein V3U24_09855 [Candidatus Neomarinimicrobiota bacterium]